MSLGEGNQVCKKCGNIFPLAEQICPFCGADQLAPSRHKGERKRSRRVLRDLRSNRRLAIYVGVGLFIGVAVPLLVTYIWSLFPAGPVPEYEPTIFETVSRRIGEFLVAYRWPVTLGVIGGAVGLLLAVREQQNRKARAKVDRLERRRRRRAGESSQ